MSTILVYTSPARGHLYPALGIALELRRRGHQVHVRTLSSEVSRVEELGVNADSIDPAIEARELDDWKSRTPIGALGRSLRTFSDRASYEVTDVEEALRQTGADFALVDTNTWGAQAAAEASGLPWATFQPYFTPLSGDAVPPFGPGLRRRIDIVGRMRDAAARPLVMGWMSKLALPGLNAPRVRLGLPELASMDAFLTNPPAVLYLTSPELEYPRREWPSNFWLVGPVEWGPDQAGPGWLNSIERPLALVTCSTERQDDGRILEAALDALPSAGYHVVGTSGDSRFNSDHESANAHVERFVAHDPVLRSAAVTVCHGGMGITQRSLAHGVPLVVIPFGRDQLEVARRVEAADAGVRLMPKNLDAESLRSAVEASRRLVDGARRIGQAGQRAGGAAAAASVLENQLNAAQPA